MLSFEAYVASIPRTNACKDVGRRAVTASGSWLGYYLRMVATYFFSPENAREVVVLAIGPGHDYMPIDHADIIDEDDRSDA